jgi:hypothetical protein
MFKTQNEKIRKSRRWAGSNFNILYSIWRTSMNNEIESAMNLHQDGLEVKLEPCDPPSPPLPVKFTIKSTKVQGDKLLDFPISTDLLKIGKKVRKQVLRDLNHSLPEYVQVRFADEGCAGCAMLQETFPLSCNKGQQLSRLICTGELREDGQEVIFAPVDRYGKDVESTEPTEVGSISDAREVQVPIAKPDARQQAAPTPILSGDALKVARMISADIYSRVAMRGQEDESQFSSNLLQYYKTLDKALELKTKLLADADSNLN